MRRKVCLLHLEGLLVAGCTSQELSYRQVNVTEAVREPAELGCMGVVEFCGVCDWVCEIVTGETN